MQLRQILCCEVNLLDSRTNTISLINLIEEINSPQFPFLLANFSIVAIFEREGDDPSSVACEITLTIGDQQLVRWPVDVVFDAGRLQRTMMNLQGLVIPITGSLQACVFREGTQLGCWAMPVNQIEQPAQV